MKNKKGVILVGTVLDLEKCFLAAASSPDFEPDLFTGRMSVHEWQIFRFLP